MKPTIGRIVHFSPFESKGDMENLDITFIAMNGTVLNEVFLKERMLMDSLAAIITNVRGDRADLTVFATSSYPIKNVPFSETPKSGHWNWPPRE